MKIPPVIFEAIQKHGMNAMFNPPAHVAKWIDEQREADAAYVRDLLLREAPTDGNVH